MLKSMKIGNFKFLFIYSLIVYFACSNIYAEDKIETLPLINPAKYKPISNSCDLTLQFLPLLSGKILVFGADLVKTRQI